MTILIAMMVLLLTGPVQAATYYVSATGSDANSGTSGSPWKSFSFAINSARAWCGDTLIIANGTYGPTAAGGTSGTTRLDVNGVVCTLGDELTIQAQNERQAKIVDDGSNKAVWIRSSAYIVLDGVYARSVDNATYPSSVSETGLPIQVRSSHHITVRNGVFHNPNRYPNNAATGAYFSAQVLFEDNEVYVFHRHCFTAWRSIEVVVRRQYCNPRGGKIPGGYGLDQGPLGSGAAAMSMYPCKDCILENSIAEGPMFLNEMNSTYAGPTTAQQPPGPPLPTNILMSGSKVLGSILYNSTYANGIFPNPRDVVDLNHSPQNITIKDVAIINHNSTGFGLRCSDCVNATVEHMTVLGGGSGVTGLNFDETTPGVLGAGVSFTVKDSLAKGVTGSGFVVETSAGITNWSGNNLRSYSNGTSFSPATPSNWGTTYTNDPGLGTCKGVWIPDGSVGKGQGTGGSDIGATILYRYVDGVLTTTPLWDRVTGAFPFGAADPDGVNRVAGDSLYDVHTRLNVNTGGCSFPASYTAGGGGGASTVTRGTTAASALTATASPLAWNHTISASQDLLLVSVAIWDAAANVGSVSGIDVSGQAMTLVGRQATSTPYRACEIWKLTSPTSGSRTITVTLTGNVSGVVGRSVEFDGTSGTNTVATGSTSGPGTSLSVTAATNTNERIEDCTVSTKTGTYTHGADQTGDTDLDHSTQSLRLATSTQDGSNGGVMSNTTGSSAYQAKVAVSLIAGTPDPPSGSVLTQTDYVLLYPIGSEATAPPLRSWLTDANAKNLPVSMYAQALVRVRVKVTASVAASAPFIAVPACRKNGSGSYTRVMNTTGSNVARFYGAGNEPENPQIPASLTPTTNRLCSSSCILGAVLRDDASFLSVPALSVGQSVELDTVLRLDAPGDATMLECRFERNNGTAFEAYTNTPRMDMIPLAAGVGQ